MRGRAGKHSGQWADYDRDRIMVTSPEEGASVLKEDVTISGLDMLELRSTNSNTWEVPQALLLSLSKLSSSTGLFLQTTGA